eukprot:7251660-Alexandrium_andersonii.AAC.1
MGSAQDPEEIIVDGPRASKCHPAFMSSLARKLSVFEPSLSPVFSPEGARRAALERHLSILWHLPGVGL